MRKVVCAVLLPAVAVLAACSPDPVTVSGAAEASSATTPTARPTPAAAELGVQLEDRPVERSFKSGRLTFSVTYAPTSAVTGWTAEGPKAVEVTVTVNNNADPGQKIYLTRVSLRPGVRGADGDLPGPDAVVDTANLVPGYLVTFPYSYQQTFAVPPVDASAARITLGFKYEFVTLVDPKAKDYTKQTTSDAVQITLAA
ncbi:hypothetical protein ACFFOM_17265 [Microlunatus capsulatus]|uniref:Lipoprotein n=1 Tax=Microlunatus capsulatus TaxID=99117 RepID=A0ABS4ZBZ2_9ACTN|nr:hypothetical protein [Microlunatus capsulatus]MBP2418576.1 hypothetical protein [Microlunatus capsulatus]